MYNKININMNLLSVYNGVWKIIRYKWISEFYSWDLIIVFFIAYQRVWLRIEFANFFMVELNSSNPWRFLYHYYCSVLNNRPLLIIIRGDIQSIKTWHFSKQSPSMSFGLFPHEKLGIYPKFELHKTKTCSKRACTASFNQKFRPVWRKILT